MKALIVIPSRFSSSRFPGKPLATIRGQSLLQRVWRNASAVESKPRVIVATDDDRIREHAEMFGAEVVMTSADCPNGSMRVCEVLNSLSDQFDIVVNVQGDAPLLPYWVIEDLLNEMSINLELQIATPATQLHKAQYEKMIDSKKSGIVSGTTVTFDHKGDALYFSKAVLPFFKKIPTEDPLPVFQHIGMYAYRPETLKRYIQLPEGRFERVEDLEQLRALEFGIPIRVVQVSLRGRTLWPVDTPEDLKRVESIIEAEGELL